MKRRMFVKLVAAAALFPWTAGGWLFHKASGVIRAARAKIYPGRIVPLVEAEVKKPGRWNG